MAKIYPVLKRLIDFCVALTGLLVLWPVFLIIAISVKLDSPGPIIYKQERLTKGAEPFTTLKFRSMVKDARKMQFEKKILPEKLVTRTGRVLRKSHFDEFLQLINVLKGEMSLVGPRPRIAENELKLLKEYPERNKRYTVKVGMAGLERIVNLAPEKKEKIISRLPNSTRLLQEKDDIVFDYYYADNYSFWMDTLIFLETFFLSIRKLLSRTKPN